MVHLEDVNPKNYRECCYLKIGEQQKGVASNVGILARSYAYRDEGCHTYSIYNDDTMVGLLMWRNREHSYILDQFMIDERYQGKGYGKQGLQIALEIMRQENRYNKVELGCSRGNTSAMKFYESCGFYYDGDDYDRFLQTVKNRLNPLGYILTTSLAPKTSADQIGLLYQGHHYPVHGVIANHVILMTYEWGYTYGPSMAVAPINQVQRVLDYAVKVIPRKKILMGMPNYGYDWKLPYKPGTAARSISLTGAMNLALREGAAILYDTVSQAPYFYYKDDSGTRHVVWFDDARSIQARLRLVDTYNLGGVSYWTITQFFPQNWLVLSSMYNIRKVL